MRKNMSNLIEIWTYFDLVNKRVNKVVDDCKCYAKRIAELGGCNLIVKEGIKTKWSKKDLQSINNRINQNKKEIGKISSGTGEQPYMQLRKR